MKKLSAVLILSVFVILEIILSILSPLLKVIACIGAITGKGKFKQWSINNLHALDNYRSAQLGGDSEDSISSRLGRAKLAGSGFTIIANALDLVAMELFNDPNHSENSIEKEQNKNQVASR